VRLLVALRVTAPSTEGIAEGSTQITILQTDYAVHRRLDQGELICT
jgi:hypothetical protein